MALKNALSIADQVTLLKRHSFVVTEQDQAHLAKLLTDNGYTRLSGYWQYMQIDPSHGNKTFNPHVTVDRLDAVYQFDVGLRTLLSTGLEVFEIALRSRLGHLLAIQGATYSYRDRNLYRHWRTSSPLRDDARRGLLATIERDLTRTRESDIIAALRQGDTPPIWDAMEVLSLGVVSKMYSLLDNADIRHRVARSFGYPNARFAESVFRSLTVARNTCAHHARIWNRTNIQVPPPVLNRLKTDPDTSIYHGTPWAWVTVLADLVDTVRADTTFSTSLRAYLDAHPQYLQGLQHPSTT